MRRDSYFPYNDEPITSERKHPYPQDRMPRAPYASGSGQSGVSPAGPVAGGMRGNAAPSVTMPRSGMAMGQPMDGMPPSSDFQGWESAMGQMPSMDDMVREALAAKMAASVQREFY